jgi:hypothetical protein
MPEKSFFRTLIDRTTILQLYSIEIIPILFLIFKYGFECMSEYCEKVLQVIICNSLLVVQNTRAHTHTYTHMHTYCITSIMLTLLKSPQAFRVLS